MAWVKTAESALTGALKSAQFRATLVATLKKSGQGLIQDQDWGQWFCSLNADDMSAVAAWLYNQHAGSRALLPGQHKSAYEVNPALTSRVKTPVRKWLLELEEMRGILRESGHTLKATAADIQGFIARGLTTDVGLKTMGGSPMRGSMSIGDLVQHFEDIDAKMTASKPGS